MHTHYLDAIVRQAAEPRLAEAVYDLIRREPGRALQQLEAGGGRILEIDGDNVISGERARHQAMAREYVGRPPAHRNASLVIDPTRAGVDSVSRLIREELAERGELKGPAIKVVMLQDAGLTRTERATATSYKQGQIVRFMQTARLRDQPAIASGAYLTVEVVEGAEIRLRSESGRQIRWEPRSDTYPVSVFEPKEKELRIGDRIRWTENDDTIGAVSGRFAKIVDVDANSQRIEIEHSDGRRHQLDLTRNEHRHLDYGYAVTIQRAQGATAYPILNAPSYRVNTIHLTSAYVGVSRAPGSPFIVTDNRNRLIRSLGKRVGLQAAALDQAREAAGLAEKVVRDLASQRHRSPEMQPATRIERAMERGGRSMER
jgi:plastocyanin